MTLHQILKGIYSLDDRIRDIGKPPVVAVHPYFFEYKGEKVSDEYEANLRVLIQQYQGPIITLEEYSHFHHTVRKFLALGRMSQSYFIKTDILEPETLEISWQGFFRFLRRFETSPCWLMGGNYWKKMIPPGGCLGCTAEEFEKENIDCAILKETVYALD